MILPTKHLHQNRALIGVGADILAELAEGRTVSELWARVRIARTTNGAPLSFDWFILALTFLYAISVIDFADGIIVAASKS